MAYTIEGLMEDAQATVATVTALKRVDYPPPATSYPNGLWAYLEYGGAQIEQASEEITIHTIEIHCLKPTSGSLGTDYAAVVSAALAVHRAFYANTVIDGEAALSSQATISKPDIISYAETTNVRCTLTLLCTTGEEVSHLVTD